MTITMRFPFARARAVVLSLIAAAVIAPVTSTAVLRPTVDPALSSLRAGLVRVIVQERAPLDASAERAVERAGGIVTRQLPIVDGFAARVPARALPTLAETASIRTLSLDRTVRLFGSDSPNSVYPKVVEANKMWASGFNGAGVTVALIDTGVADVADLSGRIVPVTDDVTGQTTSCVNLSGENHCGDSYGHGTFMAGIIAGDGAASDGKWKGVAPGARIVSLKIAGAEGAADVSNVLAAIQWVVSFRDRYGIKVLNLSLGTDSTQTYRTDPLNYAVERAWNAGIVVVVSASNRGPSAGTISKPADDPWVITVGATDDRGSTGLGDDTLPNFSGRGPTTADGLAKPDLAAPGAHVISLRAPGSVIDTEFPNYVDGSYRKGSGTSMAAAAVSGSVALLLQADPSMSPNRVKYALTSTARPAATTDPMAVGAGVVSAHDALSAPAGEANQGLDRSSGLGLLDLSRGTVYVQANDPLATVVGGATTMQLLLWDPIAFTTGSWDGGSWYGGSWYGGSWYGGSWYGGSWYGGSWYGGSWYGEPDGGSWYGGSWYGGSWYGAWE